jgi:hypothetical protein
MRQAARPVCRVVPVSSTLGRIHHIRGNSRRSPRSRLRTLALASSAMRRSNDRTCSLDRQVRMGFSAAARRACPFGPTSGRGLASQIGIAHPTNERSHEHKRACTVHNCTASWLRLGCREFWLVAGLCLWRARSCLHRGFMASLRCPRSQVAAIGCGSEPARSCVTRVHRSCAHNPCGLTCRSTGRATAWHPGREAHVVHVALRGQGPMPPRAGYLYVRPHESRRPLPSHPVRPLAPSRAKLLRVNPGGPHPRQR